MPFVVSEILRYTQTDRHPFTFIYNFLFQLSGMDYLRDPKLFKGMAFTLEERQALGIHGLLPPRYTDI